YVAPCADCAPAAPMMHMAPVVPMGTPVVPMGTPEAGKAIDGAKKLPGGEVKLAAPAQLFVSLPTDAKLSIDGEKTTSVSAERTFVSPTLEAGKAYTYTLQAEFVRDGKNV